MKPSPKDEVTKSSKLSEDNCRNSRQADSIDLSDDDHIMKEPGLVKGSRKKTMSSDSESIKKEESIKILISILNKWRKQ